MFEELDAPNIGATPRFQDFTTKTLTTAQGSKNERVPLHHKAKRLDFDHHAAILKSLAEEIKYLTCFVPGLYLRGSILQALRFPVSRYVPRDIDLLIIMQDPFPLVSLLEMVAEVVVSYREHCPVLFDYRTKITVDVRTIDEMANAVGWYEWALCRLDAATTGLPFTIPRISNSPTLDDLLDYMEYITYLGARQYVQRRKRTSLDERSMIRRLVIFLKMVMNYPPADATISIMPCSDPLRSFNLILRAISQQQQIAASQSRRVILIRRWLKFWQGERSVIDSLRTERDLNQWRIEGKSWLERDMKARDLWRRLLSDREQQEWG